MNRVLDLVCPICKKTFTGMFEHQGGSIDDIEPGWLDDPTMHVEETDDGYRAYEHGVVR
jgi:hypothetical protein